MVAGIGSRFMACFCDTLIQAALFLLLGIAAVSMIGGSNFANGPSRGAWLYGTWALAALLFAGFCVYWGYYALFEALWNGQTPGKRWAGIRVIKDTGRPINAFEAIARNLVRVIDSIPGLYAVGIITMLLNEKSRRLGDFVAGTLVVHENKGGEPELFFNTSGKSVALYQASRLSVQEINLVEAFLARRLEIPPALRRENALRIAEMVAARLGVAPENRPADHEDFLEMVVREFRNQAHYREK